MNLKLEIHTLNFVKTRTADDFAEAHELLDLFQAVPLAEQGIKIKTSDSRYSTMSFVAAHEFLNEYQAQDPDLEEEEFYQLADSSVTQAELNQLNQEILNFVDTPQEADYEYDYLEGAGTDQQPLMSEIY